MSGFFLEERDENSGYDRHDKKDNRFYAWRECIEYQSKHDEKSYLKIPISRNIIILSLKKKVKIPFSITRLGINTEYNNDQSHVKNEQKRLLNDVTIELRREISMGLELRQRFINS